MTAPDPAAIRAARERLGLTQAAAAALLGVDRVSWARYEGGTRPLDPHLWRYWLHVAGVRAIAFRGLHLVPEKRVKKNSLSPTVTDLAQPVIDNPVLLRDRRFFLIIEDS